MTDSTWRVDWRNGRVRAPYQGASLLCREHNALHCERVTLTAGLAICQVRGHNDADLVLEAPAANEPRAHWQFLSTGSAQLCDADRSHALPPGRPALLRPRPGSVAWQVPRQRQILVTSIDLTASTLTHWCDSRQVHALLFDARLPPVVLGHGAARALHAQLAASLSPHVDRGPLWRLRTESLTLQVLADGLEHLGLSPARSTIGPGDLQRLRRTYECLHEDPAPPVTLLALAKEVGMPLRRLQRLYVQRYGESLRNALQRARMQAAQRALLDGRLTIKQIAWQAGFTHATSFTHAFRAYWGQAPSSLTSRRMTSTVADTDRRAENSGDSIAADS